MTSDGREAARARGARAVRRCASAACVGLLLLLATSGCTFGRDGVPEPLAPDSGLEVAVPDVRGREQTAAVLWLESAGLEVGEVTRSHAASVAAGVVLYTDPSAGQTVTVGTKVAMIVSAGPKPGEVPAVVGKSVEAARTELERAGFTVAVEYRHDPARAGTVIARLPGGEVAHGETVTLVVSRGPETVRVPDVTGMPWTPTGGARAALTRAGLQARVRRDPGAHGRARDVSVVVGQAPAAGASVPRGAVIRLVIAVSASDAAGWVDEW